MSSVGLFLVVSKLEMWLWRGLLLPLYSHSPFSCCLEHDQTWKHFVLTEAIPVPKCLWRFSQVLTLHCLRELWKCQIFPNQNGANQWNPTVSEETSIPGTTDPERNRQLLRRPREMLKCYFHPFSVQKGTVKAVISFSCWLKAIHQAHVPQKLNNLAGFKNRCFRGILSSSSKHSCYL